MVKEFDQDPRADVWIFLDAEKKHHANERGDDVASEPLSPLWRKRREFSFLLPPDSFEYTLSAAGSIVDYYIKQGRGVGYICYGQSLTVLSVETGTRQHDRILDHLAFVRCDGKMDLLGLVHAQAPNLVRGSIVVLLTTSNYEKTSLLVDTLLHWRMNPVVIIADLNSFGDNSNQNADFSTIIHQRVPLFYIKKWGKPDELNELIIPAL